LDRRWLALAAAVVVLVVVSFLVGWLCAPRRIVVETSTRTVVVSRVVPRVSTSTTTVLVKSVVTRSVVRTVLRTVTSVERLTIVRTLTRRLVYTSTIFVTKTVRSAAERSAVRENISVVVETPTTPRAVGSARVSPSIAPVAIVGDIFNELTHPLIAIHPGGWSYGFVSPQPLGIDVALRGRIDYLEILLGSRVVAIVPPYPVRNASARVLYPRLVALNTWWMAMVFDPTSLLNVSGPGIYVVAVFSGGRPVMTFTVNVSRSGWELGYLNASGRPLPLCAPPPYPYYLYRILCLQTNPILGAVAERVFGKSFPDPLHAVWRVLEWVQSHVRYDWAKERMLAEGKRVVLETPMQVIESGRAICVEYTGLIETALLAVNVPTGFIEIPSGVLGPVPHVAPIAVVEGDILVLDQRLPPIEIGDYLQHVLRGLDKPIYLLGYETVLGALPTLVVYFNATLPRIDTWPSDTLPQSVVAKALNLLEKTSRGAIEPEPRLEQTIYASSLVIRWRGFEFYTPILEDEWVEYLAKLIAEQIHEQCKHRCFVWASMVGRDALAITYSKKLPPPATAYRVGTELTIVVRNVSSCRGYAALYTMNSPRPTKILQPTNPAIDTWTQQGSSCLIAIDLPKLATELPPGTYRLVLWISNTPTYSTLINISKSRAP